MARLIIVALLLFVRPVLAADPWTKVQVGQQVAFTMLLAADWAQTREISNCRTATNPVGDVYIDCDHTEWNPILGERPDPEEIDRYFAAAAVGHLAIAHLLPSKWRTAWQYTWIFVETGVVAHNYKAGVRVDF